MTVSLQGVIGPEYRGLLGPGVSIDVEELVGAGMRRELLCDAAHLRTPLCLRSVAYDGGKLPDGWRATKDPFGRTSRFTDEPLMLHLCPACAPHAP